MIFDLIAMQAAAQAAVWTPAELFKNGELGCWFDASDYSTMFQDTTGTTPITASGQSVALWKNKIGQNRYDILQNTAAARPKSILSSGKYVVRFDGVDDILQTSVISLNESASGVTMALGQKTGAVSTGKSAFLANGTFSVNIQNQPAGNMFGQVFGGTLNSTELYSVTSANVTTMFSGTGLGNTPITLRVNGVQNAGTAPSGDTLPVPVRIPGVATLAQDVSQVVYINRILTTEEITLLEAFIASKQ